jgi:ATP-dependent protease ClpP protease subunit
MGHKIDKTLRYITDDPVFHIHNYDIDLKANHIYLTGTEQYIDRDNEDEPGVEFSMATKFIKNLNILMRKSHDPILIHMKTCFSRKTPIITAKGVKQIKDVEVGDLVLTHTGKYQHVLEVMSQMYSGEMVRIYYGRNHHDSTSLTATSEHPVWVERNGTRLWLPMSEVVEGDIIFVEPSLCEKTGEKIPWWKRIKNYDAERLRRKGSSPLTRKIEKPILEKCSELQSEGWTVIPVDMGVRPDIIGFKDGKVVAFEIENTRGKSLEVKQDKYKNAAITEFVDEIVWITPETKYAYCWYEKDEHSPFIKVKVTGTKRWHNKYQQRVYNLTVAEDNSYVANHVVVHNCGGDWKEGMAIYDVIKSCPNRVTILNYTHARSMSSIIFQAGDKRVMMPHSTFMFHEGTMEMGGTAKQFRTEVEENQKDLETMLNIYINVMKDHGKMSKMSVSRIRTWLISQMDKREDVYLTAKEAVEYGFADEIFGQDGTYDWKKLIED